VIRVLLADDEPMIRVGGELCFADDRLASKAIVN